MSTKVIVHGLASAIMLTLSVMVLFQSIDSTPQMAWSHSKDRCVGVTVKGETIPDGCERAARGELRVERYIVK